MKTILLILLTIIFALNSVLKAQDTTRIKTIEIIAPANEKGVGEEPASVIVDVNAKFQGGDLDNFRDWVLKNLVYPPIAVENGIQGNVIIQFNINSKGKLVDAKILRGLEKSLDNEVLRVVNSSPDWKPALLKGKPVKQMFYMPVMFELGSRKKRR
jgi:protein TonB